METRGLAVLARSLSKGLTRRAAVVGLPAAAALGRFRAAAQEGTPDSAQGTVVGVAGPGENAFEFVGQIDQNHMDFGLLGYVTRLAGLDPDALFTGSDPLARSETEARLTLTASATGFARSILDGVFVVNAEGTIRFHLNDQAGASFDDPDSFASGDIVCTMSLRVQSVVNVFAPQQGIATGFGDTTIDSADAFDVDGRSVVLGEVGQRYRLSHVGQGELLDPQLPRSVILLAGNGVVAG